MSVEALLLQLEQLPADELEVSWHSLLDQLQQLNTQAVDHVCLSKVLCLYVEKAVQEVGDVAAEVIAQTLVPVASRAADTVFDTLVDKSRGDCKDIEIGDSLDMILVAVHSLKLLTTCATAAEDRVWRSVGPLKVIFQHGFQLLNATFSHCQRSADIYGSQLAAAEAQLTQLFRVAAQLQDRLQLLADSLPTAGDDDSDEQSQLLVTVCDGLAAAACKLTPLDARAMAAAWKCLLQLLQRHAHVPAKSQLQVDVLCEQIAETLQQIHALAASTDQEATRCRAKSAKLCAFHLKLVTGLADGYPAVCRRASGHLLPLVVTLLRFTPPDGHVRGLPAPTAAQLSQLTVAATPLLHSLLQHAPSHCLAALVALRSPAGSSADGWSPLALLRCWLAVVDRCRTSLPADARAAWLQRGELLDATLRLAAQCADDLTCGVRLPAVFGTAGERLETSLYERILTAVCALIGTLSCSELQSVERPLWAHLFSGTHWSSLLASDTLCFVARLGPSSLCLQYCRLLLHVSSTADSAVGSRLLTRLLPLLTRQDRQRLTDQHPSLAADPLTPLLDCDRPALTPAAAAQLRRLSCQQLQQPVQRGEPAPARLQRLWSAVPAPQTAVGCVLVAALLRTAAGRCGALTDAQLAAALSLAERALRGGAASVCVSAAALTLLEGVRSRTFAQPADARGPARAVAALYRRLLTDRRPVVRERALRTFAEFSRSTPHAALIGQSVPAAVQPQLTSYLQSVATRPRGAAHVVDELWQSRAVWSRTADAESRGTKTYNTGDGSGGDASASDRSMDGTGGPIPTGITTSHKPTTSTAQASGRERDLSKMDLLADLDAEMSAADGADGNLEPRGAAETLTRIEGHVRRLRDNMAALDADAAALRSLVQVETTLAKLTETL